MTEMRLVVVGAAGRMGRMLIKAIHETDGCRLAGAIEREGSVALGQDAGLLAGIGRSASRSRMIRAAFVEADGVLDFTAPAATVAFAELAAKARIVHVVGTTGLSEDDFARLRGRRPACAHRPVRQHVARGQSPGRPCAQGGGDPRPGLRHRDPGNAPPHEGRCAFRHRAPPRRGGGGGPRHCR